MSDTAAAEHALAVARGERFEFGENWSRFLENLNDQRIEAATESLRAMLGMQDLAHQAFVDIGSGSGLFSLAARRLGARVHSFDYDPASVRCTAKLQRRYFKDDPDWTVERGSALDREYLKKLGRFSIVYSWGVLHHTGSMWEALGNAADLVQPGGRLFIAIYNDQGKDSQRWLAVKKAYNRLPGALRFLVLWPCAAHLWWRPIVKDTLRLQPLRSIRKHQERGMSVWRDAVDWVGGLPFEVAKPEEIFDFYRQRGFTLTKLRTQGGTLGCNEFVFMRDA